MDADLFLASEADQVLVPSRARDVGAVDSEFNSTIQFQRVPFAADCDLRGRVRAEVGVEVDRDTPEGELTTVGHAEARRAAGRVHEEARRVGALSDDG